MNDRLLRIVSRQSPLAMWQAQHVREELMRAHPGLQVEIQGIKTEGDTILDVSLSKIGGKGLFVKALETCLLSEQAEIAVHSLKDVPAELPDGLILPVVLAREDVRDVIISRDGVAFLDLPPGARIGTSSLRRETQLKKMRSDLNFESLRGNVDTRLKKLDEGQFDAIVLAAAGLHRLGLGARITEYLDPRLIIPAVGQGALGIECRALDHETQALILCLHDPKTYTCISAERAMNHALGGSCQVPIGALAELLPKNMVGISGCVMSIDGRRKLEASVRGPAKDAVRLGQTLAEILLDQGAGEILRMGQ